jgi:predicted oxidoreductase (fatty acid repression mutant protein)
MWRLSDILLYRKELVMDIIEAIRTRKSIRGYKPDPVPKEVLRDIMDIATRAPSSMNTQPWEVTIVAGEVLDRRKQWEWSTRWWPPSNFKVRSGSWLRN